VLSFEADAAYSFSGGSFRFQLPAFDASASESDLMDVRHGRKI